MDYSQNLYKLKRDFYSGRRFTLFVGAGINASKSVHLLWNELIKKACEYSFTIIGSKLNLNTNSLNFLMSLLGIKEPISNTTQFTDNGDIKREAFNEIVKLKDFANCHFPIEVQVSIIKTLLGDFYIPFIQDYLYEQCNEVKIRKFFEAYKLHNIDKDIPKELHSLYVVARLILLNPQIETVISYNYDNFLSAAIKHLLNNAKDFFTEEEIEFLRLRYRLSKPIFDKVCPAVDVGDKFNVDQYKDWRAVPIFHVHGYIPAPNQLQNIEDSSIILSMDEYCCSLSEKSSWQINVQEKSIQTNHCLFIGSSLTDLTTKRLLHIAHTQGHNHNYYVLDAQSHDDKESNEWSQTKSVMRKLKNSYLTSLGLKVIDCETGFYDLFTVVSTIRDKYFQDIENEKVKN